MKWLIVLLFLNSILFAEHDEHEYQEHHLPLDMSYLKLSENQYEKLVKIVKRFQYDRKEFNEEEKEIREKISKLFMSDTFNRDEFVRLSKKLSSLSIEIQTDFFEKIHTLLTNDQKKNFIEYMQEWEIE